MIRLGFQFDLRNPPGWRRPWTSLYSSALDDIADAERRGVDSVWLTEHHMFEDGYLSQPFTFAAAVAARTRRVRIGTAVYLAALRPAIQVAEEIAVVDILSGGRVEPGFGAGYRVPEFEAFGADLSTRFDVTDNRVRQLRELWAHKVVPPPVQPEMPFWLGYRGPKGAERAGRIGVGLLALDPSLLPRYLAGLDAAGHDRSAARMGGLINILVAEDVDEGWRQVMPFLKHHVASYRHYAVEGTARIRPPRPVDDEMARAGGGIAGRFEVLTPDDAVGFVSHKTAGLPVTDLFFWHSIAGMTGSMIEEHRRLLIDDVFPRLRQL